MTEARLPTEFDGKLLTEAFPRYLERDALVAADALLPDLHERQRTDRFAVHVDGQRVLIPVRLYFARSSPGGRLGAESWLIARCLRARSSDGYERQRVTRDLLCDVRSWSAAYIVALMGEYVREILVDIDAAMAESVPKALVEFVCANPSYWQLTKQRIASYWDVYYRREFSRANYVGFRLANRIDACVRAARVLPTEPSHLR